MRVSRAQAAENRLKVIDVASRLFRERGFDGIGLNELMKAAGLTQGGFYKQFQSKEDLAALACTHAMQTALERWSEASAGAKDPFAALIDFYFSPEHRDDTEKGCPLVALGADAGRRGDEVKASFEVGIEKHLSTLDDYMLSDDPEIRRKTAMVVLSTMVGALLLSRAVKDEKLSRDFLRAGAAEAVRTNETQ